MRKSSSTKSRKKQRKPVYPIISNQLIYVKWIDACMQQYVDEAEDTIDGLVLETAGFLVRETENTLSIGMDYNPGNSPKWRHVTNIPKSYVVEYALFGEAIE